MAPDAEDCEEVERLNGDYEEEPIHQGRRILPEDSPPAVAWTENEELGQGSDSRTNSPGENRRLLGNKPIHKSNSRLQAGLTLGVWGIPKWTSKTEKLSDKPKAKTKFQKRKEKIFEALKPPYFIISMLFIIVMFYLLGNWVPESWRLKLEWSPGPWWNQPWRMFTYGLIHAGPAHIALNALVALAVGWRLEREQSWSRVAFIWMGGVAAGALGAGAFQPRVRVVGASAAVYALLTAHVPNVCFRYGHIPLWWFRPLSVVVLGASEGCWSLLRESDPQDSNNVAWAAHVLGAAVGIPLGFVAFTGENSSKRCITVLRVSSFLLLAAGIVAATIHYMFYYEPDDYT